MLTFDNAAVNARVADAPAGGYRAEWAGIRQHHQRRPPAAARDGRGPPAPDGAGRPADRRGTYIRVALAAVTPAIGSWAAPVHAYFKRTAGSWKLVGFERLPEQDK